MNRLLRSIAIIVGTVLAALLSACGGGGGSALSPTGGHGIPTPSPIPTSTPRSYQGHFIVGLSGNRQSEVVPGNGNNAAVLPPGGKFTDGGALAGARITYPDNSDQYADANGVFVPSQSTYAQKNQKLLQTNPQAQPVVIISDPTGKARPSTARVSAYASAVTPSARMVQATRTIKGLKAMGLIQNLAGVTLLQGTSTMFDTDALNLDVEGIDQDDNIVDLSTATISYSSSLGGSIAQIPGSTQAYYFPPSFGSPSITDSITVTVSAPGSSQQYSASNSIVAVNSANAVQLAGSMQTAAGAAMPSAVALFAQPSRYFAPNYWLASADSNGNYIAQVPALQKFTPVIGAPDIFSPSGSFDYFVGSTTPDGLTNSYTAPAPGFASLNLYLSPTATPFTNAPPEALPSYVGFLRDAWYNAVDSSQLRIYEAQSGIQPLLAAGPPSSFPSPASPAPIGSGQLASWCYQWEQISGAPTLVIVEASGSSCNTPGNDGFTITPGASGTFAYVKYASNATYFMNSPLDISTNANLVESGTWSQTLTSSPPGTIASDVANVTAQLYDAANQTFGSPVYNEALQYTYSVDSSGNSTEQFANDTRTAAIDGSTVAVYNATKTQVAALSSCLNTTQACFTLSGSVSEKYDPAAGAFTANYALSGTISGDGSSMLKYQSTNAGDMSQVNIPIASNAQQNGSAPCLVCGFAGSMYDVDGSTQIGSFSVTDSRLVQFHVLDANGAAIDSLAFIL